MLTFGAGGQFQDGYPVVAAVLAPASSPAITAHLARDLLTILLRHHRLAGPGTFQVEPHRAQVLV
jgi:hypothetical protein